jgi:hypothetical protein
VSKLKQKKPKEAIVLDKVGQKKIKAAEKKKEEIVKLLAGVKNGQSELGDKKLAFEMSGMGLE